MKSFCVKIFKPIGPQISGVTKIDVLENQNKSLTILTSVKAIFSVVTCMDAAVCAAQTGTDRFT